MSLDVGIGAVGLVNSQSHKHANPAMDAAAKLLGMSASDLRIALQGGQSLASIASSKGVTQDQLTAAMAAAIQSNNPGISAEQATKVATDMATRVPGAGGPGHAGRAGGPPPPKGPPPGCRGLGHGFRPTRRTRPPMTAPTRRQAPRRRRRPARCTAITPTGTTTR